MIRRYNFIDEGNFELHNSINDNFGFFTRNPLTQFDLINLSGGIPSLDIDSVSLEATAQSQNSIIVNIATNLYDSSRLLNFDDKTIDNNGLYVYQPGYGIGTTIFLNQLKTARDFSFNYINIIAQGPDVDSKYNGHYKWGRVGFEMREWEQREFEIWASSLNLEVSNLGELLLTEEGCQKWQIAGFSWSGQFDLADGSGCMNYLEGYLNRINCDFRL